MTIDWKKEVELRKEDLLKDLFTLLRIDSVRDDSKATEDAPVGPGPKEALEAFLAMGKRDGFTTKQVGNLAGHIEFAPNPDYKETLGVLGHVDVVPVGTGWDTDPFEPQIINDRIYARGSSDDKGPSMAAYYALKIIKELGLPVSRRVRFIIGTDEESGWKCMDRYFQTEEMPDFGFSPDATFPIINGPPSCRVSALQSSHPRECSCSPFCACFRKARDNVLCDFSPAAKGCRFACPHSRVKSSRGFSPRYISPSSRP